MNLESILKEEFMAGRNLGLKQGVLLAHATMTAVVQANNDGPLPAETVLAVLQACLEQVEKESS